jgi:hypothetical protein
MFSYFPKSKLRRELKSRIYIVEGSLFFSGAGYRDLPGASRWRWDLVDVPG